MDVDAPAPPAEHPGEVTAVDLRRLLNPRHIAFVGGRSLEGAIRNCEALGYQGAMWAVNPRYDEIAGIPCFPSVDALPEVPDAAFVGVGRERAVDAVRELAEAGAGGCVCLAAGFAELGASGHELQDDLVAAAAGMPLVGPNCYGVLNYLDGVALWPDLQGGVPVDRGPALVAQSGNITLNSTMADRSLSLSHVISVGNQAVLGLGDYVDALVDDPRVTAIGLYVEGLNDVPGFSRAALRALRKGVPLVALKVGATPAASRIALSHTSSLAHPDHLYRSLFERLGIVQVDSLATLLEALKLLSGWEGSGGRSLGLLTASGGDAAMLADLAAPRGLTLAPLEEARTVDLQAQLGDLVNVTNPLDYNAAAWGRPEELERCFVTMMEQAFDAVLLTLDFPRDGVGDPFPWDAAVDALVAARQRTGRRAAVVSTLPESLPRTARERMLAGGVVPLQGLRDAVGALAAAASYAERREQLIHDSDRVVLIPTPDPEPAGAPRTLDEWEGKTLLAEAGLAVPEGRLVTAAEAADAATELGFPVIVKAVGAHLTHKSDVRAVSRALDDRAAVEAAIAQIHGDVAHLPGADDRFLVERLVPDPVAELIVGVQRDERFGLALALGAGGRLVSLLDDSTTLLLPTTRDAVQRALGSLQVARLLDGYRNGARGDREAVVDAAMAVAGFAEQHAGHVLELDVNPLLVLPPGRGVVAVDVLLRLGGQGP